MGQAADFAATVAGWSGAGGDDAISLSSWEVVEFMQSESMALSSAAAATPVLRQKRYDLST